LSYFTIAIHPINNTILLQSNILLLYLHCIVISFLTEYQQIVGKDEILLILQQVRLQIIVRYDHLENNYGNNESDDDDNHDDVSTISLFITIIIIIIISIHIIIIISIINIIYIIIIINNNIINNIIDIIIIIIIITIIMTYLSKVCKGTILSANPSDRRPGLSSASSGIGYVYIYIYMFLIKVSENIILCSWYNVKSELKCIVYIIISSIYLNIYSLINHPFNYPIQEYNCISLTHKNAVV
jgi:hypothetical protein